MLKSKKGPVTRLKEEVEKLREEIKRHQNDYLRALADLDNYRKRKEEEFERFKEYANEGLLAELLPVLDNFDRALSSTDEKEKDNFYKGMEIILRQLKEVLEKRGLKGYDSLDKEFDPKFHEALGYRETDEKPPNTIIEEMAKGYLLKDRVLRPAKVIVAKEPQKKGGERDE